MSSNRIHFIDAARGFCIIVMIINHLMYDMVTMLSAPSWLFFSPLMSDIRYFFAGSFILISGISSRFSRSNVKRGIKVAAAAVAITLVTWLVNNIVVFGILHFLGFSMIFYGLTWKFWEKFRGRAAPLLFCGLTVLSAVLLNAVNPVSVSWFWSIGLWTNSFYSSDYFPIFPWIFVFLLGAWVGGLIKDRQFPDWFYTVNPPVLPQIGRKSFIIYLAHQPILFAVIISVKWLFHV